MPADTQRLENFKQLVKQFGTQTALAKRLRRANGRYVLTQQQISSTLSEKKLNQGAAWLIERQLGLPPKTLELLSLKKLEKDADFTVPKLLMMDPASKSVVCGLIRLLVDEAKARLCP